MRLRNNVIKFKNKLVDSRYDIMQGAGIIGMLFGVCGISGAIECDANLVPAVLFFVAAGILMILSQNNSERNDSEC